MTGRTEVAQHVHHVFAPDYPIAISIKQLKCFPQLSHLAGIHFAGGVWRGTCCARRY